MSIIEQVKSRLVDQPKGRVEFRITHEEHAELCREAGVSPDFGFVKSWGRADFRIVSQPAA